MFSIFRFFNYGTVQPKPTIEGDKLVIRHSSPTPCNGATNYSSMINFYCDKDAKVGTMQSNYSLLGIKLAVFKC